MPRELGLAEPTLPGQAWCHQVYIGPDLVKLGFQSGWTNLEESPPQAYLPGTEAAFGGLHANFSLASPWELEKDHGLPTPEVLIQWAMSGHQPLKRTDTKTDFGATYYVLAGYSYVYVWNMLSMVSRLLPGVQVSTKEKCV